jgi:hypothetical protein
VAFILGVGVTAADRVPAGAPPSCFVSRKTMTKRYPGQVLAGRLVGCGGWAGQTGKFPFFSLFISFLFFCFAVFVS